MSFILEPKNHLSIDIKDFAPPEIYTKSGNKIYSLSILENQRVLISHSRDRHKKNIFYDKFLKIPKDYVLLIYKWPTGRNQYQAKNNGWRAKTLLLKKYLKLGKLTLQSIGLLMAEMTKYTKRSCSIIFTNSEPNLINIILDFFKRFNNIEYYKWKWTIIFNFKLRKNETKEEIKYREESSKKFWIKNSRLSEKSMRNTFFQYTGNKKTSNMSKNTIKWGTVSISYHHIILYQLILALQEWIKQNVKKLSKKQLYWLLSGIFAGEGNIDLTKTGSINTIRIGASNPKDREFYSKCFELIGINHCYDNGKTAIEICNQENILKLYKLKIIELNHLKYYKFLKAISKYKRFNPKVKAELIKIKLLIKRKIDFLKQNIISPRYKLFGEVNVLYTNTQR